MSVRFYLIPVEEVTRANGDLARGPKYFNWRFDPDPPALIGDLTGQQRFDSFDFGLELTMLIAMEGTATEHTTLAAQSDVTQLPNNLDLTLGANLATVQSVLENLHIPADSLLTTNTYRQVIRAVCAIFEFAQRFGGSTGGKIFPVGITLSTQMSDLSANTRANLQATASALGYDYSGITLSSTIRDVLKKIATQASVRTMLGVSI